MSVHNVNMTPFKWLLSMYLGAIFLFTLLYSLPISQTKHISFIDILFLSSSGISVTGLSPIDVSTDLTRIGQFFLLLQIQIGGIGIMVAFTYLFLLLGRKFSLPQLVLMSFDQNQSSIKSIKSIMLLIFLIAFISESIGYYLMFPTINKAFPDPLEASFITIFHAVSSFSGAGFDLFGNSLIAFKTEQLFILTTIVLGFLGSIGFPVIIELITNRQKKSLFTKTNLTVHATLVIIGFITFLLFEAGNSFKGLNFIDKLTNSLFLSVTSRNMGLSTVETANLHPSTIIMLLLFMFIGASSSSCGGGIRTTTFAVLLSKVRSTITGRNDTVLFKKKVPEDDVNKSILVFFLFISIFFISTVILGAVEDFSLELIAFEIMSALTTTGLSMGITSDLSIFSKLLLIFLMIIGRVGVVTFIYLLLKPKKSNSSYVKEHIIVG